MIDTHCHFDFAPFSDDPIHWLEKAKMAGVQKLIAPSVSQKNWHKLIKLSAEFHSLYYALGLHPVWIKNHQKADLNKLEALLAKRLPRCLAIGEIGLDFSDFSGAPLQQADKEKQLAFFKAQLALAERYQYPVILHCRKAHNKMLQVLNKFPRARGVLHAFSGSEAQGLDFIKRGFLLGVGGTLTYLRANKTRQALSKLPLSKLVLETDAPDMPLLGFQGEANSPDKLILIAKTLAELKADSVENIIKTTSENARRCFDFDR
jgi:TatD DNase family protein